MAKRMEERRISPSRQKPQAHPPTHPLPLRTLSHHWKTHILSSCTHPDSKLIWRVVQLPRMRYPLFSSGLPPQPTCFCPAEQGHLTGKEALPRGSKEGPDWNTKVEKTPEIAQRFTHSNQIFLKEGVEESCLKTTVKYIIALWNKFTKR